MKLKALIVGLALTSLVVDANASKGKEPGKGSGAEQSTKRLHQAGTAAKAGISASIQSKLVELQQAKVDAAVLRQTEAALLDSTGTPDAVAKKATLEGILSNVGTKNQEGVELSLKFANLKVTEGSNKDANEACDLLFNTVAIEYSSWDKAQGESALLLAKYTMQNLEAGQSKDVAVTNAISKLRSEGKGTEKLTVEKIRELCKRA